MATLPAADKAIWDVIPIGANYAQFIVEHCWIRASKVVDGLQTTLNHLSRTTNEAAADVLITGLRSSSAPIRREAVRVLARRREAAGHFALLDGWRQLSELDLDLLREVPHRMHESLEQALGGASSLRCDNACHAILFMREYELFPALIAAIERNEGRRTMRVAATLVRLAKYLYDESEQPAHNRLRRDPYFVRRQVIAQLSHSIDRYQQHECLEIVEAYLLLVPPDHESLVTLLANPWHPGHKRLVESLKSSPAPGVMRLLVDLIRDTSVSDEVLQLIAGRRDTKFLDYLLHRVGWPVAPRVLHNFSRLSDVVWIQEDRDLVLQLDGEAQQAAVALATASTVRRSKVYEFLATMLQQGEPTGRAASCAALAEFPGSSADNLVEAALDDVDPAVQAAAAIQVRRRKIPGILPRLVALLDAQQSELRQAAQSALTDFSFVAYSAAWDKLTDPARRKLGEIVGKSDPTAVDLLVEDLSRPSPLLQLRAIEMAQAMQLVSHVGEKLIELLRNKNGDVATRAAAAHALEECDLPETVDALEDAAEDSNVSVRDAARGSLRATKSPRKHARVKSATHGGR